MKLLPVALCLAAGCDSRAVVGARVDLADAGVEVDAPDAAAPTCGTATVTQVAAGEQFTCALMTGGGVKCWGGNFSNQLGDGHAWFGDQPAAHQECHPIPMAPMFFDCSLRPVDVVGITDAIAISALGDTTCALHADGHVSCWGAWSQATTAVPVDIPSLTATSIVVNRLGEACALTSSGDVLCTTGGAPTLKVSGASAVAGTCALISGGVTCWDFMVPPTPVTGISTAVALGDASALLADGTVWAWDDTHVASQVFSGAVAIAGSCAQKADGTMWCGSAFTHDADLDGAIQWSALGAHDCAVFPDGTKCRGRDDSGEVGNGINMPTSALAPVCW